MRTKCLFEVVDLYCDKVIYTVRIVDKLCYTEILTHHKCALKMGTWGYNLHKLDETTLVISGFWADLVHHLAKLYYFTNLDFPEIRGFFFPLLNHHLG